MEADRTIAFREDCDTRAESLLPIEPCSQASCLFSDGDSLGTARAPELVALALWPGPARRLPAHIVCAAST